MNNEAIEKKLNEIKKQIEQVGWKCGQYERDILLKATDEILATLQKPKCETCKNESFCEWPQPDCISRDAAQYIPQNHPDCQKPSGEFTKEFRAILKWDEYGRNTKDENIKAVFEKGYEACDLLDSRAEAIQFEIARFEMMRTQVLKQAEQIKQLKEVRQDLRIKLVNLSNSWTSTTDKAKQLQAENEQMKSGLTQIMRAEKDRQQAGIGFDEYIYDMAKQSLKGKNEH